jgi:drug/metabolite transporter (DMT)-like permease
LLCLQETITYNELGLLMVTFASVVMVVSGGNSSVSTSGVSWWAWIILFLNSTFKALSIVLMQKARKMHQSVVSCWANLVQLLIFVPMVYGMGDDLSIIRDFEVIDWCLLLGLGAFTVLNQTLRFLSTKKCEITTLQPYSFL